MRTDARLLAYAVFAAASLLELHAGTLNGVTLPESAQVGTTTLTLNGMGVRTKYAFKVYVAGLYLAQKSSDSAAILKADAPKRIVMHFVRSVSKSQVADGFSEQFEANTPDAKKAMHAHVDRLLAVLEPMKDGDEMVFTYIPSVGTSLTIASQERLTIAGPAFAEMIFSVWLGPKPPNAGLKTGLLGK